MLRDDGGSGPFLYEANIELEIPVLSHQLGEGAH